MDPVISFLIVIVIGIAAGVIYDRYGGPGWSPGSRASYRAGARSDAKPATTFADRAPASSRHNGRNFRSTTLGHLLLHGRHQLFERVWFWQERELASFFREVLLERFLRVSRHEDDSNIRVATTQFL